MKKNGISFISHGKSKYNNVNILFNNINYDLFKYDLDACSVFITNNGLEKRITDINCGNVNYIKFMAEESVTKQNIIEFICNIFVKNPVKLNSNFEFYENEDCIMHFRVIDVDDYTAFVKDGKILKQMYNNVINHPNFYDVQYIYEDTKDIGLIDRLIY